LEHALRMVDLENFSLLTEPDAAARAYAAELRVPVGALVAVYDLGGGTFDAAVLRKDAEGFVTMGETVGIEHLGGVDFDEAVLYHVRQQVGDRWPSDPDDPSLPAPMLHLRRSCMEAKELLSSEQEATIAVMLPGVDTAVGITRAEFETMIAPRIEDTIGALEAAIESAGVSANDLSAVLLVGGSSRIPLIARMLTERMGPRVAADIDPLYAVARGAAIAAGERADAAAGIAPAAPAPPAPAPSALPPAPIPTPAPATPVAPAAAAAPQPVPPAPQPVPPAPQPEPVISLTEPGPAAGPGPVPTAGGPTAAFTQGAPGQAPPVEPAAGAGTPGGFGGGAGYEAAAPPPAPPKSSSKAKILVPLVVVAGLLAAGGAYALTRGGDDTPVATASTDGGGSTPATSSPAAGLPSADGMVEIAAGNYPLGAAKPEANSAETLLSEKAVEAFVIDETEVTNDDYYQFVVNTGAEPPASWSRAGQPPAGEEAHPVRGVNFEWASAYCASLSKRLPTEIEWEVAARGGQQVAYPWGDDLRAVELPPNGTYPAGSIPGNKSAFGVFDTVGNVWEWVGDTYDKRVPDGQRVLRGGENGFLRKTVTRLPVDPARSSALERSGFRCAAAQADSAVAPLQFGEYTRPESTNEMPKVELPPGVLIDDNFEDSTSGWTEFASPEKRFGYHPNGFFHLETRMPEKDVFAFAPVVREPGRPVSIQTSAFVDPNNTETGGFYTYGVAFNFDPVTATGLVFIVSPIESQWLVCSVTDGKYEVIVNAPRSIPDEVELEVRALADDEFEFLIGNQVVHTRKIPGYTGASDGLVAISYPGSPKAHIHFEKFTMSEQ
ncbi:MAG: Hsp70 family protein, partial [Acidimicrobiia bacterium]|nr:Hsp70 family protein [Acidimicrobiia bacterium]